MESAMRPEQIAATVLAQADAPLFERHWHPERRVVRSTENVRRLERMLASGAEPLVLNFSRRNMGEGDLIALARTVPEAAALRAPGSVNVRVPREFIRLFSRSFPTVPIAELADLGCANDLVDLAFLGVLDEWKPGHPPYLKADPALVARYRAMLPEGVIGLRWSPSGGRADVRSIPLRMLAPIYGRFPCVSLQIDPERAQAVGTPVRDVLPPGADWDTTAALVSACRAVISVDTGTAHLAGALGGPLYVLQWSRSGWGGWFDRRYPNSKTYARGPEAVAEILVVLEAL